MQEIAGSRAAGPAAWAICSGRALRFGPDWPESDGRLAFDACSGDYWVLDVLGRDLLQLLIDQGAASTPALQVLASQRAAGDEDGASLEVVLASLTQAGLIEPLPSGRG